MLTHSIRSWPGEWTWSREWGKSSEYGRPYKTQEIAWAILFHSVELLVGIGKLE